MMKFLRRLLGLVPWEDYEMALAGWRRCNNELKDLLAKHEAILEANLLLGVETHRLREMAKGEMDRQRSTNAMLRAIQRLLAGESVRDS